MEKNKNSDLKKLRQEYMVFIIILIILFALVIFLLIKDKEEIKKEINEAKGITEEKVEQNEKEKKDVEK